MNTTPRHRYSLFLQVRTGGPTHDTYRRVIDIAVAAERLGFDTIWLAARHFGAHHAALPNAFPLLAAISQHTQRLRLGTGVVALPFENPVRLVEDAAVTDHLAGGRLELGVGKGLGFGLSATAYAGFGLVTADREQLYEQRLQVLHRLVATGRAADDVGIQPDPTGLRHRIWQSTGNVATARRAARAGDGLLPHPNSEAQRGNGADDLIDAYLDACVDSTPRVGTTIGLLPGDVSLVLDTDRRISPAYYAETTAGTDQQSYLRKSNILTGSTGRLIDSIVHTRAPEKAGEWLFNVPLALDHESFVDCLQSVATEVVPALRQATSVSA